MSLIKPIISGDWLNGNIEVAAFKHQITYTRSILDNRNLSSKETSEIWSVIDNALDRMIIQEIKNNPKLGIEIRSEVRKCGLTLDKPNWTPRFGASGWDDVELINILINQKHSGVLRLLNKQPKEVLYAIIALHEASVGRKQGLLKTVNFIQLLEKEKLKPDAEKAKRSMAGAVKGGTNKSHDKSLQSFIDYYYKKAIESNLEPTMTNILKPLKDTSYFKPLDVFLYIPDLAVKFDNVFVDKTKPQKLKWTNRKGEDAEIRIDSLYSYRKRSIKKSLKSYIN